MPRNQLFSSRPRPPTAVDPTSELVRWQGYQTRGMTYNFFVGNLGGIQPVNPLTPGWNGFWLIHHRLEAQSRMYERFMNNRTNGKGPVALYEPGAAFPSTHKPSELPARQPKPPSSLCREVLPLSESLSPPESLLVTPASSLSPVISDVATCGREPIGVGYVKGRENKMEKVDEGTCAWDIGSTDWPEIGEADEDAEGQWDPEWLMSIAENARLAVHPPSPPSPVSYKRAREMEEEDDVAELDEADFEMIGECKRIRLG